jgi:hypothetical protein
MPGTSSISHQNGGKVMEMGTRYMQQTLTRLRLALAALDVAIMMTPTGEVRNKMTEINIQMMMLEEEIKKGLK